MWKTFLRRFKWYRLKYDTEPWFDMQVGEITHDGQIEVSYEYNKPFLVFLHNAGIRGDSEEEMIGAYLLALTNYNSGPEAVADNPVPTGYQPDLNERHSWAS